MRPRPKAGLALTALPPEEQSMVLGSGGTTSRNRSPDSQGAAGAGEKLAPESSGVQGFGHCGVSGEGGFRILS